MTHCSFWVLNIYVELSTNAILWQINGEYTNHKCSFNPQMLWNCLVTITDWSHMNICHCDIWINSRCLAHIILSAIWCLSIVFNVIYIIRDNIMISNLSLNRQCWEFWVDYTKWANAISTELCISLFKSVFKQYWMKHSPVYFKLHYIISTSWSIFKEILCKIF